MAVRQDTAKVDVTYGVLVVVHFVLLGLSTHGVRRPEPTFEATLLLVSGEEETVVEPVGDNKSGVPGTSRSRAHAGETLLLVHRSELAQEGGRDKE